MAELVIDRATWLRGGGGGDSVLRDYDGNMCCLGFDAIASGVRADDIMGRCYPMQVENSENYPAYVNSRINAVAGEAIRINDGNLLTDAERERQLTPVLMSLGWTAVRFVGEGRP